MNRERIRQCLDENLSGLYVTEGRHRMMMNEITAGGRPVRKKRSAALVLLAVLLIAAGTATAAALSGALLEKAIDMDVERGPLSTWSLDEKLEWIDLLSENGWSFPVEELSALHDEQLPEDEKEQRASQLIVSTFGREDAVSHVDIMERLKGPMSTWSLEDKAWYSDTIQSKVTLLDSWRDVLPEESDMTREEAVERARGAILSARMVTQDALENRIVNVSFFTNQDHEEPCWMVSWQTDPYGTSGPEYTVLMTRTGEVIEDAALGVYTPVHVAEMMAEDEIGTAPLLPQSREEQWSLAEKAQWLGDDNGLPADDEISEETAIALARQALQAQGVDVQQYAVSVWYKLYDPYAADDSLQYPAYVVYFSDHADAPRTVYGIIIDPQTGDIQRFYTPSDSLGNG